MTYRILAINPGSTSTKFAVYDGENQILSKTLNHSVEELSKFNCIMDQFEMRKNEIENTLKENVSTGEYKLVFKACFDDAIIQTVRKTFIVTD